VRFQGITQNREFGRCGIGEAVEEVIDLRGIDGQKGEAGVEVFPSLIIGAVYQTH
jgi:hypothetical protein